jgi:hypothetical protein
MRDPEKRVAVSLGVAFLTAAAADYFGDVFLVVQFALLASFLETMTFRHIRPFVVDPFSDPSAVT